MKLQLLIPQYRETDAVIRPLLDSVALQQNVDFQEIGAVIVNDGSRDNTSAICHENGYNIIGRFKDSHPEYFRIDKEGKRDFDTMVTKKHPFYKTRQLCHTSNVWKEMEEDVMSYLRGESPLKRQVRGKSPSARTVSIYPSRRSRSSRAAS